MPFTPNRAYPYQSLSDAPHGPDLGELGFRAVDADVASILTRLAALEASWQTWSSSPTNLTVGGGTLASRYRHIGDLVEIFWQFTFGAGSAVGTIPGFTLPVAPAAAIGVLAPLNVRLHDSGATFALGFAHHPSGSLIDLYYMPTTTTFGNITATVPWTWATNDQILVWGSYEPA